MPKLIFTDESTICVCIDKGGIWRKRGFYPPEAFCDKTYHPRSVMVWGGIGPLGVKTPLLWAKGHINKYSYVKLLMENRIFELLYQTFGNNFLFQQDNASPHSCSFTKQILSGKVNTTFWPSKSPDLSPIEQLWDYLKQRIKGRNFTSGEELFDALFHEWNSIPDEVIHNCYSSFKARCEVCVKINGQCLNGHWTDMHSYHDAYRTEIVIHQDPNTGIITKSEKFIGKQHE